MTDLTLEEYRRYPPEEMRRKIREDAEKAFGLKDTSLKTKRIASSSKMVTFLNTKLPFIRLKKSH
jgi:hypothetical protein